MNIGIDIDGVIADFVEEFIKVIKERYDFDLKEKEIIYHDLYQVLGITKSESLELINETLNRDLNIIKDADIYIDLLSMKNDIYILTARNINLTSIEKWLKKHNIKYNDIVVFEEGGKNFCDKKLDVIIDDNLKEAIGFIGKCEKIIIFDHPWNQTLDIHNSFYRVSNWYEIYEILK